MIGRIASVFLVAALAWACGGDDEVGQGTLSLRSGASLEGAQVCGVELPQCPTGLSCIAFTLDDASQALCLDDSTICTAILECGGGTECVILESYPAQIACSGKCTGSDCDDSVGDGPGYSYQRQ